MKSRQYTLSFARMVLLAVLGGPGCRVSIVELNGPEGPVHLEGRVLTTAGQPIPDARVAIRDWNLHTDSDGHYSVYVPLQASGELVQVSAPGYASSRWALMPKHRVFRYQRDFVLAEPQFALVEPSLGGNFTVESMGNRVTVHVPGGFVDTTQPVRLALTSYTVESAPGVLQAPGLPGENRLQSGAMLQVLWEDSNGNPLTLRPDATIAIDFDGTLVDVPRAGTLQLWSLAPDARWRNGQDPTEPQGTSYTQRAESVQWLNLDRRYTTACVRAHVLSAGLGCSGLQVRSMGPRGVASEDVSDRAGAVCLEGPLGTAATLRAASVSLPVNFPSETGNCITELGDCVDVGNLILPEAECPYQCSPGYTDSATGCVVDVHDLTHSPCIGRWSVDLTLPACRSCRPANVQQDVWVSLHPSGNSLVVDTALSVDATIDPATCEVELTAPGGLREELNLLRGTATTTVYCVDQYCGTTSGTVRER